MSKIEAVFKALPTGSHKWATARDIADELGMGYSTAGKYLAQLATEGRAESRKEGRVLLYRRAGRPVETVHAPVLSGDADEGAGNLCDVVVQHAGEDPQPCGLETPCPEHSAAEDVAAEAAAPGLWVAVWRRGINHHAIDPHLKVTRCGRSILAGGQLVAEPPAESNMCPRCAEAMQRVVDDAMPDAVHLDAAEPAETATEPTDPASAPATHDLPEAPADGSLAAVAEWMGAVRPVSAPPADANLGRRTRTRARTGTGDSGAPRSWARGELRDAVLAHLRGLPEGEAHTPHQIAKALGAYVGPVATNCRRQVAAGTVAELDGPPVRYRAA